MLISTDSLEAESDMALKDIRGNDRLVGEIRRFAGGGNVHHAYIIEGAASARKMDLAKSFAEALLCNEEPGEGCGSCRICRNIEEENHIDLLFVRPERSDGSNTSSIKTEQIEALSSRLRSKPVEGQRNIVIIEDFDKSTPAALNTLLKTLEEPPEGTVIMMLSENTALLPQTIVSRSVVLRMMSFEDKDDPYHQKAEEMIAAIAERSDYARVKAIVDSIGKDRDEAVLFLDSLEDAYRERLLGRTHDIKKAEVFRAIDEIEAARRKIKRSVGVGYALKRMALGIGGPI